MYLFRDTYKKITKVHLLIKSQRRSLKTMSERQLSAMYPSASRPWELGHSLLEKNPIIPNTSIYRLLKLLCIGKKEKPAIECGDLTVSYWQMFQDAKTVSIALTVLGVKRGDIIAICMPNFYQAVIPFLACNRIGAIATYLNPGMSDEEIKEYLKSYNSPVFFNFAKSQEDNSAILKDTPTKYTVTLQANQLNNLDLKQSDGDHREIGQINYHSLGCLLESRTAVRDCLHNGKSPALILYTSGSTGQPKSVLLTNENVIAALMYANNTSDWDALGISRILVCVPFAYPYGFVTSLLSALFSRSVAILAPDIGQDTVQYYYAKKPEMVFGSPALLDLTIRGIPEGQDLSSVKSFISGGDFLTMSHAEKGKQFFAAHNADVEIGNGAGNAETVSIATTPAGIKNKPETVGIVLVGSSAIVVDPTTMQEKPFGEEGMLCIAGKHVFKEYYKEPALTEDAKFIFKGKKYFKTGTLGFLDEDGYFTLTGRSSRFYIRSSLDKVYLDHVQNVICCFDCVYDCAVVKVPDEEQLYVNYAYIVLDTGWQNNDEVKEKILDLCHQPVTLANGKQDQLKEFEIPQKIFFLDELPRRSGTEKIDYALLEERAKSE